MYKTNGLKAQASFFVKLLFIIIASVAFVLLIIYTNSFKTSTIQERESSNFKIETLSTLQKLVTDKNCLAYQYNQTPQKIVLDKNKIDSFSSSYENVEPECAKAIDFDYSIKIVQYEYNFSIYPGEIIEQGDLTVSNEFSSHRTSDPNKVVYFDCNFNPQEREDICLSKTELDKCFCNGCTINPRENCPYDEVGRICCIYYECSINDCESVEVKDGMGDCSGGKCIVAKNCDLSKCKLVSGSDTGKCGSGYPHGACGLTYEPIIVPVGEMKNISIVEQIWSFGLSLGVKVFSPPKAKGEELTLSLPITIRYNETFSTQGIIYIYAVKGELESLYSTLEDICNKIEDGIDVKFSKQYHFSYPIEYRNGNICMLDSCKNFICKYQLDFQPIEIEGDYLLEFSFDQNSQKILVRK